MRHQKEVTRPLSQLQDWLSGGRVFNRRREKRLPAHGEVILLWRDEIGQDREILVPLINVSGEGISIRAEWSFPLKQEVSVTDGLRVCRGLVRRCSRDGEDFTIGIERFASQEILQEDDLRLPTLSA